MKKVFLVLGIIVLGVVLIRFTIGRDEDTWICDKTKNEWIKHGNPGSSKPETPCGASEVDKTTQVEEEIICDDGLGNEMNYSQAKEIALKDCTDGEIKDFSYCNNVTGTWWVDFAPSSPKEGCNPACVVSVKTASAEVNWRCTGLKPD